MRAYFTNLTHQLESKAEGKFNIRKIKPRSIPYFERFRQALGLPVREGYLTDWFISRYIRYPVLASFLRADVVHLCDDAMAHLIGVLNPERTVISCFDLRPFKESAGNGFGLHWHKKYLPYLQRATRVLVSSEATKEDLMALVGVQETKIRVIPLGVDSRFRIISDSAQLERIKRKYDLGSKHWALHVGVTWPQKNIENIIRALQIVTSRGHDIRLMKVGGDLTESQWSLAQSLGISDRICSLGYVSDEELVCIYNLSAMVLMPSFCEGFGFPILEGFACGVPVITSPILSMPELGGEAACYVDPAWPEDIAEKMVALVHDPALRERCKRLGLERVKGFEWADTASKTLGVYREVFDEVGSL